jgi:exonuclease SbcD
MRILHTSDWHVGKTLRGVSRHDEHAAVLGEIVEIARTESVDLVLVTGDLFETAAPTAEAKELVFRSLLALRSTGAEIVVIGGNHDHARDLDAVAPVFAEIGITVRGTVARPGAGGTVDIVTRGGERARVALLPFVSQRYAVRVEQLVGLDAAAAAGAYAERVGRIVEALCAGFDPAAVNILAAHCTVVGGALGGGEREAQSIFDYWLPAQVFPTSASYVALGHLHRQQQIAAGAPAWYAGSPIHVDFGEEADAKGVLLVEVEAGVPARVNPVALSSPRPLRTVRGTIAELATLAAEVGDAALRVIVHEPARAGLADDVRALLPNAVDVRVDAPAPDAGHDPDQRPPRQGRSPLELFADFLADAGHDDPAVERLFAELLDEELAAAGGEP